MNFGFPPREGEPPLMARRGDDKKRLNVWAELRRQLATAELLPANDPGFLKDVQHFKHCNQTPCNRCKFVTRAQSWYPHLQLGNGQSWLATRTSEEGSWSVGCICCSAAGLTGQLAKFMVCSEGALQLVNLRKHHNSDSHRRAALAFTGSGHLAVGAPSAEAFKKLWDETCTGRAPSSSIDGVGSRQKLQKMLWCLAEALRTEDRAFLAEATCIGLFRDERDARLSVRFCACNADLEVRHAHMGLRRHFGTGAIAITAATRDIIVRAATSNAGGQARSVHDAQTTPVPMLDQHLLGHIQKTIKMVAVDSALDEVNSVRDMAEPAAGGEPLAPNLEVLLRDKAHGARRNALVGWCVCFLQKAQTGLYPGVGCATN